LTLDGGIRILPRSMWPVVFRSCDELKIPKARDPSHKG
jgi:hypothetical protein